MHTTQLRFTPPASRVQDTLDTEPSHIHIARPSRLRAETANLISEPFDAIDALPTAELVDEAA